MMDILDTHSHLISPEPNSGCWLWTGSLNNEGYGQVNINKKTTSAHRVSANAPLDKVVMHKCDVRCCVNPDHLVLGTQRDNIWDMHRKGRASYNRARGEQHSSCKLTDRQVVLIRASLDTLEVEAQKWGVGKTIIANIKNNKTRWWL